MSTVLFFPEGAYGPTNNCVGVGQILRWRGHRVVFVIEKAADCIESLRGSEPRARARA